LQRIEEENILNGILTNEVWKIIWKGLHSEQAEAQVMAVGGNIWFSLICDSADYVKNKEKISEGAQ